MIWQLFVWTLAGELLRLGLLAAGVPDPLRARVVALAVLGWTVGLLGWGAYRALGPVPVREREVRIDGLGPGLDGLRVVLLTDTHYGPIDPGGGRRGSPRWSTRCDADVVAHTGDIADGSARRTARAGRAARRGDCARLARVYVTGNHEYFSGAQRWVEHMASLGWEALHNRHVVVSRGDDPLVVAGVDDRTAARRACPATTPTTRRRWPGPTRRCRSLLLAHQPQQVPGRSRTASTCSCPGTPTAARSGRSTIWSGSTSRSSGAVPARRAHPALHEPGHRLLGAAVPDLRPEGDHPAHAATGRSVGRMGVLGEMFPGRKIRSEAGKAGSGQGFRLGPIDLDSGVV